VRDPKPGERSTTACQGSSRRSFAWLAFCGCLGFGSTAAVAQENAAGLPVAHTEPTAADPRAELTVARAEALFQAANYEAARSEFVAAYELMNGDPRQFTVLYNIAVCRRPGHGCDTRTQPSPAATAAIRRHGGVWRYGGACLCNDALWSGSLLGRKYAGRAW
jgi:hypothetical protein